MKKRGISPIIASILLIVFILVISVVVVSWMRKSVEKQIESGEERGEETTEINQEIVDYFKENLDKGLSYKEIKKILMEKGWDEDEIERAYNSLVL